MCAEYLRFRTIIVAAMKGFVPGRAFAHTLTLSRSHECIAKDVSFEFAFLIFFAPVPQTKHRVMNKKYRATCHDDAHPKDV